MNMLGFNVYETDHRTLIGWGFFYWHLRKPIAQLNPVLSPENRNKSEEIGA